MMITEILSTGRANAISGRDLAFYFGCNIRDITKAVERERRQGSPICATSGNVQGYYLGSTDEVRDYCRRLEHREKELSITRQALYKTTTTP